MIKQLEDALKKIKMVQKGLNSKNPELVLSAKKVLNLKDYIALENFYNLYVRKFKPVGYKIIKLREKFPSDGSKNE